MRILVATLVALGLAAPAMAANVKWSGDLNNRFSVISDSDMFTLNSLSGDTTDFRNEGDNFAGIGNKKEEGDSDMFGDIKYRMRLTATDDDKKVTGVVGFEFGSRKYGATGADFGGDDNVFELQHAYTKFEVPFDTSATLTVGLQPVGYNKFVWSDNAGGVKYAANRGALAYSLGWFRNGVTATFGNEEKDSYDDVYALDATFKASDALKLGAFAIHSEKGSESDLGSTNLMDSETWYGLSAAGQADALFFGATAIYLDGEVKGDDGASDISLDRKAYFLNAEGTVKLDAAKVRLGYMYASGDDDATDNDLENFDSIDVFMGGYGSVVIWPTLGDDNGPVNSPYIADKGLSLAYLGADVDLSDKASVGASYLWWNSAEDIDGADADTSGESDLGHELTVRGSYKIAKGLTGNLVAGYFIGGDAWDELQGAEKDADDVWRTDASFRYKF